AGHFANFVAYWVAGAIARGAAGRRRRHTITPSATIGSSHQLKASATIATFARPRNTVSDACQPRWAVATGSHAPPAIGGETGVGRRSDSVIVAMSVRRSRYVLRP